MAELKMSESKEWLDEPNREEFEHAGYKCLVLRHDELLHLCGYVAIPRGHPCYRKHYDYIPYQDLFTIAVHGGLTFSNEGDGKFHPAGDWWLGFDCAHAWDLVPFMDNIPDDIMDGIMDGIQDDVKDTVKDIMKNSMRVTYRNFQYVRQETKKLADQIAKLEFIDWQFTWVWPLLLPVRTACWIWARRRNMNFIQEGAANNGAKK